jgi:hypothetical protein
MMPFLLAFPHAVHVTFSETMNQAIRERIL